MDRADGGPGAAASRAERFEDEKRRIIESCFSKKDTDGSLLETYITHLRITEYSAFPSTPPPPQARTPETEKPRVIVVAVRKSGRVRMHKSKENGNGTFSIGKTWNLDDLSAIESYTGPQVNPHQREWAQDTGFLVNIGKAYFWQAQTEKEKKFFIASLIKIYGKYTGGKVPELNGFEQKELDQVLGAGRRQAPPPARPSIPEGQPSTPSQPSFQTQPSAASTASLISTAPPTASPDSSRLPRGPPIKPPLNGTHSPAQSFESATSRERPQPRWNIQNNKSQESVATSFATRSDDASSLPPRSRNGITGSGVPGRFGDPRDTPEPLQDLPSRPPQPQLQDEKGERAPTPERRRPMMDPSRPQDRDLVPPPLMSPAGKKEPVAAPPRLAEQPSLKALRTEKFQEETPNLEPSIAHERSIVDSKLDDSKIPEQLTGTTSETTADTALTATDPQQGDDSRPGFAALLQSKKSKSDIAGAFWKAANAATNFKPRPGGAGERLRLAAAKAMSGPGPDGITSVVPAPPRAAALEKGPATPDLPAAPIREPKEPSALASSVEPSVVDMPPASDIPQVEITPSNQSSSTKPAEKLKETRKAEEAAQEANRRSIVIGNDSKYLQALGVDASILDKRSQEFGKWLDFFGWVPGEQMRTRNVDELRVDIDREVNKAQAGGWLARFREEDDRVDAIKKGVSLAMAECEEFDNLLTLYSVELSTLSDDIAYIEAQGQGLQVQTANQKLLKKELESLLETCAITSSDLEALRLAPLESSRGLEDVEKSLAILYKAMMKIDPSLGNTEASGSSNQTLDPDHVVGLSSDYGQMRIVQEKKEMYLQESEFFMRRLVEFMARQFDEAYAETKRALDGALSKKVDATHHDAGRNILWKYSPLMLYARDADLANWNRLIQIYQDKSHPVYKKEFQSVVTIWRKNAKKLTGEEAELLFTFQAEKQQEGVATTARKLTVKRSQTLARALRSPLADGHRSAPDKGTVESRTLPYEVFLGVLDDLLPLVEMEQNFIVDFFHATTLEQVDFPDAVATTSPASRHGGDLKRHRLMEPDRELARRVTRSMEVIFTFLDAELQRLIEWVIGQDPLQGAAVLAILDKRLVEIGQSNQDFLNMLLQRLHSALEGRFVKFVDEQIRAIEDTKVKINKRKGVISFIRVFPTFLSAVENMLAAFDPSPALRRTIDREYDRILKSMFDSLMVIAREHPAAGVSSGGTADPEGKEALNFHILLIENMNHFLEETDTQGLEVLEDWKEQGNSEFHEHMDLYLNAVMRRPLGKLLDYIENIEAQLQTGKSPSAIARQPSNSKTIFAKTLSMYDAKEVRKGVETLRKRVEKHFGDADDPALSRGLVAKVLKECETFYESIEGRIGRVTTDVYGGDVPFEWPRADVKAAFR